MTKKGNISNHFDGRRFFNPVGVEPKTLFNVFTWMLTSRRKPWPKAVENKGRPALRSAATANEVVATFVNHATYLLQFQKTNVLIDPVFAERTSPVRFAGPKRVRPPGILLEQLPKIDLILVTHNHYDHMDLESLKWIVDKFNSYLIAPLGNRSIMASAGIKNIHELDWWQVKMFNELEIILTPAQHWSGRGLRDRFEALWGGFYINFSAKKIFWAGDTGYGPHFLEIQRKLGRPDLSFLPIGAYEPRWFMKDMHMNPADAILAHKDLETPLSIGMHFGTFQLTDEGMDDPVRTLEEIKATEKIKNFIVLNEGETRSFALD